MLKLTTATERSLRSGITIEELPPTFRDAINIVRRIGYRYIWIDSLCIFQDSLDDWTHESRKIGHIYRGSICTIAALASASTKPRCFAAR
ncbi:HET-domain-containing protein, partial [Bimuria novae-zelandiae CBS 107.79]